MKIVLKRLTLARLFDRRALFLHNTRGMKFFRCLFAILMMAGSTAILADEEEIKETESAELFSIIENDFEVVEGEEVQLRHYVETVNENIRIISFADEAEHIEPGEHEIKVLGVDQEGNCQTATLNFSVLDEDEWNDYVRSITRFASRKAGLNNSLREEKGHAQMDAIELAKQFIGMKGSCDKVAQAFLTAYFGSGYSMYNTYQVSIDEIKPGDVIFYSDGGLGMQHWAVYLGGDSALHGNINNTTVIGSVYMNYGTMPTFYRIYGTEEA